MQISTLKQFQNNYKLIQPNKNNNSAAAVKYNLQNKYIMPNALQVLAFQGGKSLSLSQTAQQIKKFGQFPPDMEENIEKELENKNPKNKTLIDIHREKYGFLNRMDTLEEAKLFFPEFEDVKSDSEIDYSLNSFTDRFKKGEIEYLDPKKKDLALQMLQIYWGDGFSLNDISREITKTDIQYTLRKLNIPRLDKTYAHYLKFSDKKYNERLAKTISEKTKGKKKQRQIPAQTQNTKRGPLSEEHKSRISKSLIEYYKVNPKQACELSEENLEKFENFEENGIFRTIISRAWKYPECKPVRKALSRYMKKDDITDKEILKITDKDSSVRKNLKGFFAKNPWAKGQLSKAMKKSWERQKELDEMGLIREPVAGIKFIPTKIAQKIERETHTKGLAKNLDAYIADIDYNTNDLLTVGNAETKKCLAITSAYMRANTDNVSEKMADTFLLVLLNLGAGAKKESLEKENPLFEEVSSYIYKNIILDNFLNDSVASIGANKLQSYYRDVIKIFCRYKMAKECENLMHTLIDETYNQCVENKSQIEIELKKGRLIDEFIELNKKG